MKVVQGQRVVIDRNPVTGFLSPNFQTLVRAEDARVSYWQVNIAPVYRFGAGPFIEGMPGRVFPFIDCGRLQLKMTWGGGGVNFRTNFAYPQCGSSFVVSGDNIQLEVAADDTLTPFAPENVPVATAWVKPMGAPSAQQPLVQGFFAPTPLEGPRAINPWTRAIIVGADTVGATITVRLYSSPVLFVSFVYTVGLNDAAMRVPVAGGNYLVEVFASVGNVMVAEEYSFT